MHAAESSTYSETTPTSVVTADSERETGSGRGQDEPVLPEDIGRNTAALLLEEIVKVAV